MAFFQIGERQLSTQHSHIMGILNVTPDSFSDGGRYCLVDDAIGQAQSMIDAGAAIIDVGGESTRPDAQPVSVQQELDRVLPIVEKLNKETDTLISVDTSTPEVMTEAARLGAHLINDVRALQRPGALVAAAQTALPVCLMHMQGQPQTMQRNPHYQDVLREVSDFLTDRIADCTQNGIAPTKIMIDPGFGFGKTAEHNLCMLNRLEYFEKLNCPVLVGLSRKSMIGAVLNKPVSERLYGSLALAAAAVIKKAFIIRVHDVAATVDIVRLLNAMRHESIESIEELI